MVARGTGWVIAQFVLMGLLVAAGFVPPHWPHAAQPVLDTAGAVAAVAGAVLAAWAGRALGHSLSPFPRPVGAGLVETGPFAVVRHPIYTGGLLFFGGYALFTSVPALVLTGALALLWAGKLTVEERLLAAAYPGYGAYRARVRFRLVPFVY